MNWKLIIVSICISVWFCALASSVGHAAADRPQCEPKQLQALRSEMKAQFGKDSKAQVIETMANRWDACRYSFDKSIDVQWLASDFAFYLYKMNQKRQCKKLFCGAQNFLDCYPSPQMQTWIKSPSNATKALVTNVEKCLKTSETGIDDVKLLDEYKSKKLSGLPICRKGPFFYVRFYPKKDEFDEVTGAAIVIASSANEAAKLSDDDMMFSPYLVYASDINGDGFNDLLLNKGGCGSGGDCVYQLYGNCGKGKYVELLGDTQTAYEMQLSKSNSTIDGTAWRDLEVTFRYKDYDLGCDGHLGDFTYPVKFKFDGNKYSVSKAEQAKNKKIVDGKIEEIRQQCLKAK